jgi:tRNA dimethylallyltransferase
VLRAKFENYTIEQLHEYCNEHNIALPENDRNKRYLIRAIERNGHTSQRRIEPISNSIIVGIATERDELRRRIEVRNEHLFETGVVEEATILGKIYGWNSEAMTGNIYPIIHLYLENEISFEEMKEKNTTLDWRLAKRQLTWFKRNPCISWFSVDKARTYIAQRLANEHKS